MMNIGWCQKKDFSAGEKNGISRCRIKLGSNG